MSVVSVHSVHSSSSCGYVCSSIPSPVAHGRSNPAMSAVISVTAVTLMVGGFFWTVIPESGWNASILGRTVSSTILSQQPSHRYVRHAPQLRSASRRLLAAGTSEGILSAKEEISESDKAGRKRVIPLLVINLFRNKARLDMQLAQVPQLDKLGLKMQRIAGFPMLSSPFLEQLQSGEGKISLDCTEVQAQLDAPQTLTDLCAALSLSHFHVSSVGFNREHFRKVPGSLGCLISHLFALRQAYLDGHELVIIAEDDISWKPLRSIVAAHTQLMHAENSSRAYSDAYEARSLFEAAAQCASNVESEEGGGGTAGVGGGGGQRPVVVQLLATNPKTYRKYDVRKGRRKVVKRIQKAREDSERAQSGFDKECLDTRFECGSLVVQRVSGDWGTQAVLWNRAAIAYAVDLFWRPGPNGTALSEIALPEQKTKGIRRLIADRLFYNFPAPFGDTMRLSVPVAVLSEELHLDSVITNRSKREVGASGGRKAVQAYTRFFRHACAEPEAAKRRKRKR